MCWNWQVSIGSFAIISATAYALFKRGGPNDRFLAVFIASYGSMQLFETLMWLGQNPGYEILNKIGSLAAALALYTHPLAFFGGMSIDVAYKQIDLTWPLGLSVAYLIFGVFRVVNAYINGPQTYLAKPDSISNYLVWDHPNDYWIGLLLMVGIGLMATAKFTWLTAALLAYFFLPVLIAMYRYGIREVTRPQSYYGSYWCWYCAAFSFLFYFRPAWV